VKKIHQLNNVSNDDIIEIYHPYYSTVFRRKLKNNLKTNSYVCKLESDKIYSYQPVRRTPLYWEVFNNIIFDSIHFI